MSFSVQFSWRTISTFLLSAVLVHNGVVTSIDIINSTPDISIGGWMENDFENNEWNTNSSPPLGESPYKDAIVVPNSIRGLSLVCNASYPIEWKFHKERWGGHSRMQYALRTTRVSNGLDVVQFSSEISFFSFESNGVTGNYTCQKVGNPWLSQSLYVFWEGGSPPYLTLARAFRKPPQVPFRNDSISFTLPCMTSTPTVTPHLTKEVANAAVPIKLNSSVQYDPRVGFTLTNLLDPYGRYTCQGGDDDEENEGDGDLITFNVVNADDGPKPEFNETMKHGAFYNINSTARELTCCSAGQKPPRLKLVECDHPTICALAKHTLHEMESAKKRELSCSIIPLRLLRAGVFRCVGAGIDVVREFFYPIPEDPKKMMWGKGGKGGKGGRHGGRRRWGGGKMKPDNDSDVDSVTQAPLPVITDDPYFDWNEADSAKMMMVSKLRGPLYIGENKTFSCRVSHFYYAQGLVWGVLFKNQSIVYLNGRESKKQQQHHPWMNLHHFKIMVGRNQQLLDLTITADLQNITCYAPIWNSTEWGKKSINFVVKEPTVPVLNGKTHKEYSWYLNDTQKTLKCEFTGEPWPTVVWMKGNATLTVNVNTTNGTSTLLFPRVTLDTDGSYECILSNPAGVLTKTFKITVLHSTSGAISAILIFCVIGFVVVSAIAAILFKYLKSQNNVINHLANLAFKDVTNPGDGSSSSHNNSSSTGTNRSAVSVNTNGVVLPPLSTTSQPISISGSASGTTSDPFRTENGGGRTNHGFVFDYSNRPAAPSTGEGSTQEGSPPTREPPLSSFSSYHKF